MAKTVIPLAMELIPGYRFVIYLADRIMGFQKIAGISREIEMEEYREGGLNTRVHVFPKACAGGRALHMEKGIYQGSSHPFYVVGERITDGLSLFVLDNMGMPQKRYLFTGLTVKKWEVGDLSAVQNDLLIDRFEVSYEDFDILL